MSHPTHNTLRAAYSFYNVSKNVPWVDLIGDALILAKKVNDLDSRMKEELHDLAVG